MCHFAGAGGLVTGHVPDLQGRCRMRGGQPMVRTPKTMKVAGRFAPALLCPPEPTTQPMMVLPGGAAVNPLPQKIKNISLYPVSGV